MKKEANQPLQRNASTGPFQFRVASSAWLTSDRWAKMHPLLKLFFALAAAAGVFWLVLALVGWLQNGKKKNSPPLYPGPDEAQNLESDSGTND